MAGFVQRTVLAPALFVMGVFLLTAPDASGQDFGTELVVQVRVEADSTVNADPSQVERVVELAVARGGCLPRAVDVPDVLEYLTVAVRVHADGTHRLRGVMHRGDEARTVFDNEGRAGYGPLLGALLAGLVETAAAARCAG